MSPPGILTEVANEKGTPADSCVLLQVNADLYVRINKGQGLFGEYCRQ